MKKIYSLLLSAVLTLMLVTPAFAVNDVKWDKDTTITNKFNDYGKAVVESGVTVTFPSKSGDPNGITIHESITVMPGGKITGGGIIILKPGATVNGLDIFYTVRGEEYPAKDLSTFFELLARDDYVPTLEYRSATDHWVLVGDFRNDPFPDPDEHIPTPEEDDQHLGDRLYSLGLFKGVGVNPDGTNNYDLYRAPKREEAIVILIRLLGKEAEALSCQEKSPFTDVDKWFEPYAAYASKNGLTNGIGNNLFGFGQPATGEQFLTFVLRALGYDDAAGDFSWNKPQQLAESCGIMFPREDMDNFMRRDTLATCEAALRTAMKDGNPLYKKLIREGVFSQEQYDEFLNM